jgi:hypothetical protein
MYLFQKSYYLLLRSHFTEHKIRKKDIKTLWFKESQFSPLFRDIVVYVLDLQSVIGNYLGLPEIHLGEFNDFLEHFFDTYAYVVKVDLVEDDAFACEKVFSFSSSFRECIFNFFFTLLIFY